MQFFITPLTEKEQYYVEFSWYCPENGEIVERTTVTADELGVFLMERMPYQPNKSKKKPANNLLKLTPVS